MSRTQQYLGWGLTVLVALMPFHAFLSVWAGHLAGHQAIWQAWKEVLVAALALLAIRYVWQRPRHLDAIRNPLTLLAGAFVIISAAVTAFTRPDLTAALFGLKTDFEFLGAFILAMLVADERLRLRLTRTVLITSGFVIAFGLLQIFLLPKDFLTHFGYGPHTVTPYQMVDPAIPDVRILSTLGGPNQLGSFLILPLSLVWWRLLRRPRWWQPIYLLAGGIVMFHTFSRSAWLGMAASLITIAILRLPRRFRLAAVGGGALLAAGGLYLLLSLSSHSQQLQYYVLHQTSSNNGIHASTNEHASSLKAGLDLLKHHPLGLGLGAAGPASFHSSHGIIPENYYVQIALETGLLGLLLFIAIQIGLAIKLIWRPRFGAAAAITGALAGIAVINLFLHGWADSSTALVFWTFAGAAVGERT